jgi:alkanesulfonate monooxygenase SsuD/methylene tetrahydromethanopterin reductase-like flavin-dependent oxidoreductase (luciferase family)
MEQGARDAGRDPETLRLALMANAFVADERAWEIAAPGVMHQLGAYEAWDAGHDTPERDSLDAVVGDEHAARRSTAAGTADDVAHALEPIVHSLDSRAEADLIVRLHYPGMAFDDAARAVSLFGERVLPALRDIGRR